MGNAASNNSAVGSSAQANNLGNAGMSGNAYKNNTSRNNRKNNTTAAASVQNNSVSAEQPPNVTQPVVSNLNNQPSITGGRRRKMRGGQGPVAITRTANWRNQLPKNTRTASQKAKNEANLIALMEGSNGQGPVAITRANATLPEYANTRTPEQIAQEQENLLGLLGSSNGGRRYRSSHKARRSRRSSRKARHSHRGRKH